MEKNREKTRKSRQKALERTLANGNTAMNNTSLESSFNETQMSKRQV